MRRTLTLWIALAFSGVVGRMAEAGVRPNLGVELVVDGLVAPLDLTFAPDGSGRRFIVDQTGLVLILTEEDEVLAQPFLDITDRVVLQSAFDERGLLALAFHPEFAENGRLYVTYSAEREGENICVDEDGNVPEEPDGCPLQYTRRVSEFTVSEGDPNRVDPDSERVVFSIQWPGRKHNGGGLAFGPDGFLHIGLGDGGWIHGPDGDDSPFDVDEDLLFGDLVAQDLTELYGKILRIDVDGGEPYGIPADNPFVGEAGIPGEIFAWGFRNPFRISFDRLRGGVPGNVGAGGRPGGRRLRMFVSATADMLFEATYMVTGPGNYGWARKEGTHCVVRTSPFAPPEVIACADDGDCPVGPQVSTCGEDGRCGCSELGPRGEPIRDPVIEYLNFAVEDPRSEFPGVGFGRASLGGHMYRGSEIPGLFGKFVQGDFAVNLFDGQIMVATPRAHGLWELERAFVFDASDPDEAGFMKSIGRDAEGELYAITGNFTPSGLRGKVWKIVSGSDACDWNGDGVVDGGDMVAFLGDLSGGAADFNGDGMTDMEDLLDFLACFAEGAGRGG